MVDLPQLKGIRVLVIEDDDLSSLVAQEMLAELGCIVAGAETSVDERWPGLKAANLSITTCGTYASALNFRAISPRNS